MRYTVIVLHSMNYRRASVFISFTGNATLFHIHNDLMVVKVDQIFKISSVIKLIIAGVVKDQV